MSRPPQRGQPGGGPRRVHVSPQRRIAGEELGQRGRRHAEPRGGRLQLPALFRRHVEQVREKERAGGMVQRALHALRRLRRSFPDRQREQVAQLRERIGAVAVLAAFGAVGGRQIEGVRMRPASPMVRRKRDFFEWEFTKKMNAVRRR